MRSTPALLLRLENLESRTLLSTYYVAPGGSDGAVGTSDGAAWATLQRAANAVGPGDTVIVRAGNYAGFNLNSSHDGTADQRVTFRADPGVVVDRANGTTSDGINLEYASYVTVEGFTVRGTARSGIRSTHGTAVVIRNNVAEGNAAMNIFASYSTDLLLEGNVARNSTGSHGIYVSNSAERPTVRGNRIYGNPGNGLHFNGDGTQGGPEDDGMVDHALVEGNIIYENGAVRGGSAINCDGLRDSVIRNNLVYNNYAAAIKLYAIDAAGPSSGNRIENNTVVIPAGVSGRWAVDVRDYCINTVVRNNVLVNLNTSGDVGGAINVWDTAVEGFTSDHNVVNAGRVFRLDGIAYPETLAEWRARGYDAHSVAVANVSTVFANLANNDFRLKAGSPAVNAGMAIDGITTDLLGTPRPVDGAFDAGAYELPLDNVAPTVLSSSFDLAAPAHKIVLTFSEDVSASLSLDDFTLMNEMNWTPLPASAMAMSRAGNVVTLTVPGLANGRLPDGYYRLTVNAAGVSDLRGNQLDGNADGTAGDNYSYVFTYVAGDANRDANVNFDDLLILSSNYQRPADAGPTQGDFNYDGVVNFDDMLVLAKRYNSAVAPGPLPTSAAVTAAPESSSPLVASAAATSTTLDAKASPFNTSTSIRRAAVAPKRPLARR